MSAGKAGGRERNPQVERREKTGKGKEKRNRGEREGDKEQRKTGGKKRGKKEKREKGNLFDFVGDPEAPELGAALVEAVAAPAHAVQNIQAPPPPFLFLPAPLVLLLLARPLLAASPLSVSSSSPLFLRRVVA
eukprot:3333666-Rhodomonas_salina.1